MSTFCLMEFSSKQKLYLVIMCRIKSLHQNSFAAGCTATIQVVLQDTQEFGDV